MQKTNKAMEKEMKSKFVNPFEVAKGNVEVLRPMEKRKQNTKTNDDYYLDVIKYLITNSKRYNEENLYINVIDCLLNDIYDVDFCVGCKHFKGKDDINDIGCEMPLGSSPCRDSLIERAKNGELNIKEQKCTL